MFPNNLNFGVGGWFLYFALGAVLMLLASVVAFCNSVEKAAAGWLFLLAVVFALVAVVLSFAQDKGK